MRRGVSFRQSYSKASADAIVVPSEGDTFRTVYTVRFGDVVYVGHAFQKKSKKGVATPQKEIELIRQCLAAAERDYRERQN